MLARCEQQGSILGPLLFLIYVNDMPESISSHVFLFADNTKLIRTISNWQTMYNFKLTYISFRDVEWLL